MQYDTSTSTNMKVFIDGRLYDTSTSTKLAISRGIQITDTAEMRYEDVLYRTAKGALFIHCHHTQKAGRGRQLITDTFQSESPASAVKWIEERRAVVLNAEGLPMPEEA